MAVRPARIARTNVATPFWMVPVHDTVAYQGKTGIKIRPKMFMTTEGKILTIKDAEMVLRKKPMPPN